jgi:hypothetical protein
MADIKCAFHGVHGSTRDNGKTCGFCFAEQRTPSKGATIHVPVPDGDINPEVAALSRNRVVLRYKEAKNESPV